MKQYYTFFWQCPQTHHIISDIETWIDSVIKLNSRFTNVDMILGVSKEIDHHEILNIILLVLKKYIYATKLKKKKLSSVNAKLFITNFIKIDM